MRIPSFLVRVTNDPAPFISLHPWWEQVYAEDCARAGLYAPFWLAPVLRRLRYVSFALDCCLYIIQPAWRKEAEPGWFSFKYHNLLDDLARSRANNVPETLSHGPIPTVRFGFVSGPLRLENLAGEDQYASNPSFLWLRNYRPVELKWGAHLSNFQKWFGVTHLQKRSRFFFLITKPFCLHIGLFKRLQTPGKPGSEHGVYLRSPGTRWEPANQRFIRTYGYAGLHLD